jgi:hypothetical protein
MAASVKNADRLKKKFAKLRSALQADILANAVIAGALPIQNAAKENVRVDTGTAKRSISTWLLEKSNTKVLAAIGTPKMSSDGKSLSYTWYLEFKYPFLRPAYDSYKHEAQKIIQEAIKQQLHSAI